MTGDIKLWAFYVSVVAIGAKIAAFAMQYVAFRILVTNRICARAAPDARRLNRLGLRNEMRYTARPDACRKTIPVLRRKQRGDQRWRWTETGTSP